MRFKNNKFLFLVLFATIAISLEGVPTFTRNLGMDCTACHTAYPQLTEFGKVFLETGGEILIQKEFGKLNMTPQIISGHIGLLPIDKSFSADSTDALTRGDKQLKLRAFNEVNAYLAGRVGRLFYFTVFTASDEWGDDGRDGFDARFEEGFASYNMLDHNLNLVAGYDSPFITDGNDTVQHHNVFDRQWKAAEYTPDTSQMIGLNGLNGDFYWIASWHGGDAITQGNDPKSFSLRASYNFYSQTLGTYFSRGFDYNETAEQSQNPFSFYGVDGHFRFKNSNILTVFGLRKLYGLKTDWDVSVEANTVFTFEDPCISKYLSAVIPMVNVDVFVDRTTSTDLWVQGSLGMIFYVSPAVRIFPQFTGTALAPSSYKHQERKFLISADIGL